MASIGYARVSKEGQGRGHSLDAQRGALEAAGCAVVYVDQQSGADRDRPELERALAAIAPGDVLVFTRLDRLARSTAHLLDIVDRLRAAGADIRSLAEPWLDSTGPAGRLILTVMAGVAQFERERMIERVHEGLARARAAGKRAGPKPVMAPDQVKLAVKMLSLGERGRAVAKAFGVSPASLYRYVGAERARQAAAGGAESMG